MDLKQLRAFVTVADVGSVTRASTILNIVQPAVTRQLKLLEGDVGTPLFERARHGMTLTDAGKTLLTHARRILDELERAKAELQPGKGEIGGIVNVGLLPSTCDLLASALVGATAAAYPGIRIRITMGYAGYLQQWLDDGEIDAALVYYPMQTTSTQIRPLIEESLWAVGLPTSGLTAEKAITFDELARHPMVLPSASHGLRGVVDHASSMLGLTLSVVAETNAMSVQKSLVLAGHGMTILPRIAVAEDIERKLLVAAPLTEPALTRTIVLALPGNRATSTPARCVVALLEGCMHDAVKRGAWPAARWVAPEV